MIEKNEKIEVQPESNLSRLDDMTHTLLNEFGEEGWDVYHDSVTVKWSDSEEKIQVKIEQLFSYNTLESWTHCYIRVLPVRNQEHVNNGSQKTLVFSLRRGEKSPVAFVMESPELRWGTEDWEGRGERVNRAPSEYDLMEFDMYLSMVKQDKERKPHGFKRTAASHTLGKRALEERSLETSDLEFFLADTYE